MSLREDYLNAQEQLLERHGVAGTSRFIDVRGLRTHLIEAGEGPPVVFVIGGGGFAGMWIPLLARLTNHTLYAVDRPGFGLTDSIDHRTDTLREEATGFLEGLLDGLGIGKATMVANSMGSLWTFWLAIDRPERVDRMVHCGCPALILDTSAPVPLRLLGLPVIGRILSSLTPPSPKQARMVFDSMNEGEALAEDPTMAEAVVATERLPTYDPAWRSLLGAVLTPFGARKQMTLATPDLRKVEQPVQLIWGEHDPFGGLDVARRAAEALPDAHLDVVAGGHLPWLDSPERVASLVDAFVGRT